MEPGTEMWGVVSRANGTNLGVRGKRKKWRASF
jgi:hypothetical protein